MPPALALWLNRFHTHHQDQEGWWYRTPTYKLLYYTVLNQLDLPAYESYEKLRHMLLLAIQECSKGFGLA